MRLSNDLQSKRIMPENTIPLINIVFLMLIFFLIAGTVAPPVSTELQPPVSQDLPLVPPASNAIEILRDGSLLYRGVRLSVKEILTGQVPIGIGSGSDKKGTIEILADKQLAAAELIKILQALRVAGYERIHLITVRGDS